MHANHCWALPTELTVFFSIPKTPQVYSAYYRLLLTLVAHAVCALKSTAVVCCVMCVLIQHRTDYSRARGHYNGQNWIILSMNYAAFFILKRLENKHYRHSTYDGRVNTESQYIRY